MKFPTIKQLESAIAFWTEAINIRYDEVNHNFTYTELVPYRCYDSGGSVDSIGFEETLCTMSFLEAYQCWEDLERFFQEHPAPEPVSIENNYEEIDLPF